MRRTVFFLIGMAAVMCLLPSCDIFDSGIEISGVITMDSSAQEAGSGPIIVGIMSSLPPESTTTLTPTWASGIPNNPLTLSYASQTAYRFPGVSEGSYVVVAWVDLNRDSRWEQGEPSGCYPAPVGSGMTLGNFQSDCSVANITLSTSTGGGTSVAISGAITLNAGVTLAVGKPVTVGILDAVPAQDATTVAWAVRAGVTHPTTVTWSGSSVTYSFSAVAAGEYMIVAWADINDDGAYDIGEPSGTFPEYGATDPLYNFSANKTDANITLYAEQGEVSDFAFPGVDYVWKGVLLTNPDTPANMAYVYVDTISRYLSMITSTNGGESWSSSAVSLEQSAQVMDFAAAMDASSNVVVEYVRDASDNSGTGASAYWIKTTMSGSKTDPMVAYYGMSGGLCRLPSVFRASGSCIYFGIGYDLYSTAAYEPGDTSALSFYWDGGAMTTEPVNVGLSDQTDNPFYVQQVYGEADGTLAYLYFDNHYDWSSGDLFLTYGSDYTYWSGAEYLVGDAAYSSDVSHGMLFKAGSGYVLVYAVKNSDYSSHVAWMSHASDMASLYVGVAPGPTSAQLSSSGSNLAALSDDTGAYHVMYAAQDPTSGAVYVAWQETDASIMWVSIDPSTYEASTPVDAATGHIDGASALDGKFYISYHYATDPADVVEVAP